MSKSLGNYIGITEAPEEIFRKTSAHPRRADHQVFRAGDLAGPAEIDALRQRAGGPGTNPSHLKRELARDLAAQFHLEGAAKEAEAHFNRLFVEHERPETTGEWAGGRRRRPRGW